MKLVLTCTFLCSLLHAQVSVPFQGCASDGQTGPEEAPKGKSVSLPITARAASQLAYYKSENGDSGVLGPRNWYCYGTYGSGGNALYVSPEPIDKAKLFSTDSSGFLGPAIEFSQRDGDTSGRFDVAEIIARVFPAFREFATHVMAEFDPPVNKYTFGPWPTDALTYKSKTVVEYKTPANTDGMGTHSWLKKNNSPIEGVAILAGQIPDALLLAVRLPPNLTSLTSTIIHEIERDAARMPGN